MLDATRDPPLVGAALGDRFDRKAPRARPRIISADAGQPRVLRTEFPAA